MNIIAWRFKRKKDSDWEMGIKIEGNKVEKYLDKNGKELKSIYEGDSLPVLLNIPLNEFLKHYNK